MIRLGRYIELGKYDDKSLFELFNTNNNEQTRGEQ